MSNDGTPEAIEDEGTRRQTVRIRPVSMAAMVFGDEDPGNYESHWPPPGDEDPDMKPAREFLADERKRTGGVR